MFPAPTSAMGSRPSLCSKPFTSETHQRLPYEMLVLIFQMLDPDTFRAILRVCPKAYVEIAKARSKVPFVMLPTLFQFFNDLYFIDGYVHSTRLPLRGQSKLDYNTKTWTLDEIVCTGGGHLRVVIDAFDKHDPELAVAKNSSFSINLNEYNTPLTLKQFIEQLYVAFYAMFEGSHTPNLDDLLYFEFNGQKMNLYFGMTPTSYKNDKHREVEISVFAISN